MCTHCQRRTCPDRRKRRSEPESYTFEIEQELFIIEDETDFDQGNFDHDLLRLLISLSDEEVYERFTIENGPIVYINNESIIPEENSGNIETNI